MLVCIKNCNARPQPTRPRRRPDKLDILRTSDAAYIDQIRKYGLYDGEIWQAFASCSRSRRWAPWATAAPTTTSWACAPSCLHRLNDRGLLPVRHEIPGRDRRAHHQRGEGVNRGVYDVTGKPPGTVEWA